MDNQKPVNEIPAPEVKQAVEQPIAQPVATPAPTLAPITMGFEFDRPDMLRTDERFVDPEKRQYWVAKKDSEIADARRLGYVPVEGHPEHFDLKLFQCGKEMHEQHEKYQADVVAKRSMTAKEQFKGEMEREGVQTYGDVTTRKPIFSVGIDLKK